MKNIGSRSERVDETFYLETYPYIADVGLSPQIHYEKYGRRLGYLPYAGYSKKFSATAGQNQNLGWQKSAKIIEPSPDIQISPSDFDAVVQEIDLDWYRSLFPEGEAPEDPVAHYLTIGHASGFEPTPWFNSRHYAATHEDVAYSGMNPFVHYVLIGKRYRKLMPTAEVPRGANSVDVFRAHANAGKPGPLFEEYDPRIGNGKKPKAKVIAYYLPQYHAFAENNEFWGKGFTEWRNIMRGMPRFDGHLQPRIPRDLGFYNLDEGDTLRRQFTLAQSAGIHGFCFYHYWFDGKRVMETPMERLLADPTLEIPFSIMWANENWSRTWDGDHKHLLLEQTYQAKDDIAFVDDLARHFKDPRYIRISGRPVFYVYRASEIPDTKGTLSRWRDLLRKRHSLNPLFFMAQTFDDFDPTPFGFDGAIEFPPHQVLTESSNVSNDMRMIDPNFSGLIFDYEKIVDTALNRASVSFPLIRTSFPSWDNDARRPGKSTIVANSTPSAFGRWLRGCINYAAANPIYGETLVCINAWNEWAEGAYLEPDTHYGAAYLNEFARAVFED
jgi:hypothetical protein